MDVEEGSGSQEVHFKRKRKEPPQKMPARAQPSPKKLAVRRSSRLAAADTAVVQIPTDIRATAEPESFPSGKDSKSENPYLV